MRKARIALTAVLVSTLGFGLTACNGDSEDGATEKESPTAAATAPSPDGASPSADGGDSEGGDTQPAGDVTAPGTGLKVGDKAVLPFEYAKKKGTLAITVTAIDKGTEADMSRFGERAKGLTPYFIKMKVENVGDTDLSRAYVQLRGLLDGGRSTGVSLIGDIPGKCDKESAPAEFGKGVSYETCSLAASQSGDVTGAEFDDDDAYGDKPVVWTAG
ncbi:hypothetical protein [Streptomyces sp. NPDC054756]